MNIFVTDFNPLQSAANLPDKHIVKMPLETCQMLSIIQRLVLRCRSSTQARRHSISVHNTVRFATIHVRSGLLPISTIYRGSLYTACLCDEYAATLRQDTFLLQPIIEAIDIYHKCFDDKVSQRMASSHTVYTCYARVSQVRHQYHYYTSVYRRYLNTKPWLSTNLRIPSRKPSFIV